MTQHRCSVLFWPDAVFFLHRTSSFSELNHLSAISPIDGRYRKGNVVEAAGFAHDAHTEREKREFTLFLNRLFFGMGFDQVSRENRSRVWIFQLAHRHYDSFHLHPLDISLPCVKFHCLLSLTWAKIIPTLFRNCAPFMKQWTKNRWKKSKKSKLKPTMTSKVCDQKLFHSTTLLAVEYFVKDKLVALGFEVDRDKGKRKSKN